MWKKNRRCDSNACVDVAPGSTRVWVRDSTAPGVVLSVPRGAFVAFVDAVRAGQVSR